MRRYLRVHRLSMHPLLESGFITIISNVRSKQAQALGLLKNRLTLLQIAAQRALVSWRMVETVPEKIL